MGGGKGRQFLVSAGHLGADGIVDGEPGSTGTEQLADFLILRRALGGLGENFHGLGEIQRGHHLFQHPGILHHNGVSVHLAHQPQHFCVSHPAEDDNLAVPPLRMQAGIGLADAFLKLEHHGAGAVNQLELPQAGLLISGRRFSVGTDEHGSAPGHFFQAGGRHQAFLLEAGKLGLVVYDGTQRIQPLSHGKVTLRAGNGTDHSSAEAGAGVYLYLQHDRPGLSRMPNLPWSRPSIHTSSSWSVMWVLSIT